MKVSPALSLLVLPFVASTADYNALLNAHAYEVAGAIVKADFDGDGIIDPLERGFKTDHWWEQGEGPVYRLYGTEPTDTNLFGWELTTAYATQIEYVAFDLKADIDEDGSRMLDWIFIKHDDNTTHKLLGSDYETGFSLLQLPDLKGVTILRSRSEYSSSLNSWATLLGDPLEGIFVDAFTVFRPVASSYTETISNAGRSENTLGYYGEGVRFGGIEIVGAWYIIGIWGDERVWDDPSMLYYMMYTDPVFTEEGKAKFPSGDGVVMTWTWAGHQFFTYDYDYGISEDGNTISFYGESGWINPTFDITGTLEGCLEIKSREPFKTYQQSITPIEPFLGLSYLCPKSVEGLYPEL